MASTKSSSRSAKSSGTAKSSRGAKTSGSGGRASTASRRKRAKPPSRFEKVVGAASRPGIAAGAAATVVGGVALAVRRRRSRGLGFDAHGVVKRIGKTTQSLGKTSKELGKEMQRLGDDAESAGKTLS